MAKHRWLRRTIGLGVVAGAAYAVWRVIEKNQTPGTSSWEPQPFPFPPQPRAAAAPEPPSDSAVSAAPRTSGESDAPEPTPGYVEPIDGACPVSHPVKAKLASGIFHVPGGQSYERTTPDRCYVDAAAATRDGLRASKR